MKCVSGGEAQYLCVNRYCDLLNAFVCSQPSDRCKENHQSCALLSLSFILKKAQVQSFHSSKFDALIVLQKQFKVLSNHIDNILSSTVLFRQINKLLLDEKPLTLDDKDKINKFVNDRKQNYDSQGDLLKLDKEFSHLQMLMRQYKQTRKTVVNLKETFNSRKKPEIEQSKNSILPVMHLQKFTEEEEFDLEGFAVEEMGKKKSNIRESRKISEEKISQSNKQKSSEKKVQFEEMEKKVEKISIIQPIKSKISSKVHKKEVEKSKGFKFEEKPKKPFIQKPQGPFFSRITNNFRTISLFFQEKFQNVNLLYRATQNDFSVTKFHERCDGHKNTITFVLNEFDKVIGGFTPLAWRSNGEWFEDQSKNTFLFSLSIGEKYPIIDKTKAIWCNKTYGPSFGYPDLEIAHKANQNTKSCSNFPICFNNGDYQNNQETSRIFSGTKTGNFRIKEWQVYELQFP